MYWIALIVGGFLALIIVQRDPEGAKLFNIGFALLVVAYFLAADLIKENKKTK